MTIKKKVAVLILNRNLPRVTDNLRNTILKYNKKIADIYIVDSGSDKKLLSKHSNFKADWVAAKKKGLRFGRGMNFGLGELWKKNKFKNYNYYLLLTNDTLVPKNSFIKKFVRIMDKNIKIGLLSPCSKNWGEKEYLVNQKLKYFWFIHNNAFFLRREFIEDLMNNKKPHYMNFLFDGNNFRGYGMESELIAKGYLNDWASAITSEIFIEENENYLLNKSQLIKTEPYDQNLKLYIQEGIEWMHKKYGFKSKWAMQMYTKRFYDLFFDLNPELKKFKI